MCFSERKQKPLPNPQPHLRSVSNHTQRWTRIYGNTIFLPRPLKRVSIAAERRIPWIGRQYLHAAHVVPTGCAHVAAG